MARKVFFSFHYNNDYWRVQQVLNIGSLERNNPVSSNDWEKVKKNGDIAVKNWINGQLAGKSCTIVLVGEETADRKWVRYEIERSWELEKAILGIRIHKLEDMSGHQSNAGSNPFSRYTIGDKSMSSIVKLYDPPYSTGKSVYKVIKENIIDWVEEAIIIRSRY